MNELKLVPPKSEWDVDPWKTAYMQAYRYTTIPGSPGVTRHMPMLLPIQVVLDTFRVQAWAGKPIDVRVEFNR